MVIRVSKPIFLKVIHQLLIKKNQNSVLLWQNMRFDFNISLFVSRVSSLAQKKSELWSTCKKICSEEIRWFWSASSCYFFNKITADYF